MCRITLVSLLLLPPLVFAHGDGGQDETPAALEVGGAVALSHYSAGVTETRLCVLNGKLLRM